MDQPEAGDRRQVIDQFVERLVQMREDAGAPSFRQMAKRSGAISHATMHDAVQGVRLPSWETSVEFAKACGADPEDLRADWERAKATLQPVPEKDEPAEDAEDAGSARDTGAPAAESSPEHREREPHAREGGGGRSKLALAALVAVVVVVAGVFGIRQLSDGSAQAGDDPAPAASTTPRSTGPKSRSTHPAEPSRLVETTKNAQGCPGNVETGPPQPGPRTAGDKGALGDDVDPKDCSVQKRGAPVQKRLILINKGTVDWSGRKLVRIRHSDTDPACSIPSEVVIPKIKAGESKVVKIDMTAPDKKAVCFARWMQMDADNEWAFPSQWPYYLSFRTK